MSSFKYDGVEIASIPRGENSIGDIRGYIENGKHTWFIQKLEHFGDSDRSDYNYELTYDIYEGYDDKPVRVVLGLDVNSVSVELISST